MIITYGVVTDHSTQTIYKFFFKNIKANYGHLYIADHGSMDRGLMDHMDLLFQDCTTHIVNFAVILNISMCMCVSVLYL